MGLLFIVTILVEATWLYSHALYKAAYGEPNQYAIRVRGVNMSLCVCIQVKKRTMYMYVHIDVIFRQYWLAEVHCGINNST